jgi:hypothetical protein
MASSHALTPTLGVAAPPAWSAARLRLILAALLVSGLGAAGFAVASALPTTQPSPPASFLGTTTGR